MDVEAKDTFQTNRAMITDQAMFICALSIFAGSSDSKRRVCFDSTFFLLFSFGKWCGCAGRMVKHLWRTHSASSAPLSPRLNPFWGLAAGGRLPQLAYCPGLRWRLALSPTLPRAESLQATPSPGPPPLRLPGPRQTNWRGRWTAT